jgi:hypothetical protein
VGGLYLYRVDPVVVDVGWDNSYIIATRRPPGQPRGVLFYCCVDIAKDTGENDGGRGDSRWSFDLS